MRIGETYRGAFTVKDSTGALAAADTTTVTVTKPDGTTSTPTATMGATGNYTWSFTPTLAGRHPFTVRTVLGGVTQDIPPDVFHVDDDTAWVPLVALDDAKDHLGMDRDRTVDDAELRRAIVAASRDVENATRLWARRTVVDVVPPDPIVRLKSRPVISVTSVAQGATTFGASTYRLNSYGQLVAPAGSGAVPWSTGSSYADLTVTYVAGETAVPLEVREAVLITLAEQWGPSQRGAAALPLDAAEPPFEPDVGRPAGEVPPEAQAKLRPWLKVVGTA